MSQILLCRSYWCQAIKFQRRAVRSYCPWWLPESCLFPTSQSWKFSREIWTPAHQYSAGATTIRVGQGQRFGTHI